MFYLLLCVSGVLCYDNQGYHYQLPSQNWNVPAAATANGSNSQYTSNQTSNVNTQLTNPWRGTDWAKPINSANNYGNNNKLTESRNDQNNYDPIQLESRLNGHNKTCESKEEGNDKECQNRTIESQNITLPTSHGTAGFASNTANEDCGTCDIFYQPPATRPPPMYLPPIVPSAPPTRPPPPSTRPPPVQYGPATMSEPVPTLREFYAPSLQYHVGIYTKTFTPYMQICGGSLVKADVALSAAHCFWSDGVGILRAALFAVAAGKLLRPWEIPRETFAQRSDVKDIKIPSRFQGGRTSFQDDIAVVTMTEPFEYAPGVQPVCISFDLELERSQLKSGSLGTIAGWGLTQPNGPPSQRLNFLKLPYVDIDECIGSAESSFVKYITSDKICAGDQKTGRALCRGDSGGGLVYYSGATPYLRGIASTAQRDSNECNAHAIASFTHVRAHRTFLEDHVPGIAEGCQKLYANDTGNTFVQNGSSSRLAEESELNKTSSKDKMQDQMKIDTNVNGKEQTLEQKDVVLLRSVLNEKPTSNTLNRHGLNKDIENAEMLNVTREPTIQIMPQSGTMNKEELATLVTTSWSQQTKLVTMRVERGERSVVTVPVDGASAFVCDCLCRN